MQSTTQPKISKPLQYAYIAAFGGMLLGLAGWSLKAFPSFSAAEGTTVLNGKLAHASKATTTTTSPSSAWAPTSGPRWTTPSSTRAAPAW